MNANLPERFRGGEALTTSDDLFTTRANAKVNLDIRKYVHAQEGITALAEKGDWRSFPEIPTNEEISIVSDEPIELSANKIRGAYRTPQKYLKTHFMLLREDAISPLRDAVSKFRDNPEMMDDQSLSIYEKVGRKIRSPPPPRSHIDPYRFESWGSPSQTQALLPASNSRLTEHNDAFCGKAASDLSLEGLSPCLPLKITSRPLASSRSSLPARSRVLRSARQKSTYSLFALRICILTLRKSGSC
jgi:hypothetical protein